MFDFRLSNSVIKISFNFVRFDTQNNGLESPMNLTSACGLYSKWRREKTLANCSSNDSKNVGDFKEFNMAEGSTLAIDYVLDHRIHCLICQLGPNPGGRRAGTGWFKPPASHTL